MAKGIRDGKRLLDAICAAARPHNDHIMQGVEGEREHALEILRLVLKQNRQASPSLKLAALFHDIDRLVNPTKGGGFKGDRSSQAYIRHKKSHARRSVRFIAPLLRERGFADRL